MQMRESEAGRTTQLSGMPRGSNAGIPQDNAINPRTTQEGQLPELRGSVSTQGKTGQATVSGMRESGQSNASRGLQQASGNNVVMQEVSPNATRGPIAM